MSVTNVSSAWVSGNLVFYDKDGNIIVTYDGTNRKLSLPSGSTLEVLGTSTVPDASIAAAKLVDGAGVAAALAAGLGGSTTIIKSETGTKTIVAANATKDRACLVIATVTEAFATGNTSRTIVTVGEASTPDKMWAATAFPNGLALGTVLVGAFTNTSTKAISVTSTAAVGTGTGAVAITVVAIPTT